MGRRQIRFRAALGYSVAALALGAALPPAHAFAQASSTRATIRLPAQPLEQSLKDVARQTGVNILFAPELVSGMRGPALSGRFSARDAVARLIAGKNLKTASDGHGGLVLRVRQMGEGRAAGAAASDRSSRNAGEDGTASSSGEAYLAAGQAEADETNDIVVTGTRIRGTTTPSPIIQVTQEDIREAGFTDLGDVIRSIPQNFSGGQNPGIQVGAGGINNQNITSGSSLNLRGLGPDATLTLLNGRRLSYSGFVNAIDISVIPVAALDRIEVIADGASAIYGSDAVAGVANVIIKRDYEGVTATARGAAATDGGAEEYQFSLTAGTRWSSGGIIASFDRQHAEAIFADQREYTEFLMDPNTIYPEIGHYSGLVSGHQKIGDFAILSIDGLYTERKSLSQVTQTFENRLSRSKSKVFFVSPSLEIPISSNWSASLSGAYGKDQSRFIDELSDPDGAPVGSVEGCYCNTSRSAELGAEGPLVSLPGGDLRIAMGVGYRRNDFKVESFSSGSIVSGKRSSHYAFGEIYIPLISPGQAVTAVNRLSVTAALRYENYRDLGKVTTPKVGFIYEPTADFALKGSWGRSYKAPNLSQQYQQYDVYLFPAELLGATGQPADATALLVSGGNPNLKPERAESWTATLSLHPQALRGLNVELSYYDIDYSDRVVQPITNLAAALRDPIYAEFLSFSPSPELQAQIIAPSPSGLTNFTEAAYDPANVIAIISGNYVNVARQRARGFDLSGSYLFALGGGEAELQGSASWLRGRQQMSRGQPQFQTAGMIFNPPKFRARGGAVWNKGGLSLAAFVNYVGSLIDNQRETVEPTGSFTTVDAIIRYRISKGRSALSNIEFSLAAHNLFDQAPPTFEPLFSDTVNYDSTNYSAIGRVVSLSVTKNW